MLAKKTSKNQITLPKKIVNQFPGVDYFDVTLEDNRIVLRPINPSQADEARKKLAELGIKESDIAAAIAWARSHDP